MGARVLGLRIVLNKEAQYDDQPYVVDWGPMTPLSLAEGHKEEPWNPCVDLSQAWKVFQAFKAKALWNATLVSEGTPVARNLPAGIRGMNGILATFNKLLLIESPQEAALALMQGVRAATENKEE